MALASVLLSTNMLESFTPSMFDVITGTAREGSFERDPVLEQKLEPLANGTAPRMDVLARMETVARTSEADIHRQWMGEPDADVRTAPRAKTLQLRILRSMRKGDEVTCYFANHGDEVTHLEVSVEGGEAGIIHPAQLLKKKESGWFSVRGKQVGEVHVTCDDGAGLRANQVVVIS
jgi:hypothetical protein